MNQNDDLAEFALEYAQYNGKKCEYVEIRSEFNSTDRGREGIRQ